MKQITILIITVLLTACNSKSPDVEKKYIDVQEAITKTLAEETDSDNAIDGITEATSKVNHTTFNGTLIVPPQHYASVTLTMGGTVHSVTLIDGQYVRKGEVLVTLKNPEFITLQQNYLEAHAQMEYLEAEYNRQKILSAQEAASQKRFQQSKADFLSMKSRLDATSAQLLILGITADNLVKNGIYPYLEVKAPINGYIASMHTNLGKHINAGDLICSVIDKGEMLLCLTAYEKDLDSIIMGSLVEFRVNGMGEQTFNASIISVGQEVDIVNRSLEVYAKVKETNSRFRPGMYVTARVKKN